MRVLFLTHNFPRFTGDVAGSFLLRLAHALRDAGVDVRVVAPSAAGLAERDVIDGIDVVRFRYAPRGMETLAYTGNMASDVQRTWRARAALGGMLLRGASVAAREARRWNAEILHAHWWFPAGLSATIPGAPRLPLIVTSHGSDVRLARSIRPARRLLQRVVRRADHYTFVSRWLRDEAAALTPLGEASIAPMPVDVSLFAPPSPGAARRGILFVGRINAQKGVAELLQALARQRTPADANIVGDGPDAASVRALADSLGITDRVRWHPAVTQVRLAELYRSAEVLAVPSREEGLGLVAAEAMLCETPVIAFASGGLTDVVADGVNGLLAPTGDIDAFARALDTLIAEPTRARALGTRGRLDVLGRFSPAAVGATYKAIYDSVLARRQA